MDNYRARKLALAVVLSVAAIVTSGVVISLVNHHTVDHDTQQLGITADFFKRCAGQPYTDVSAGQDIAMCGARISGFVAGHDLAMEQIQATVDSQARLWCIPDDVTEATYVTTIHSWAEANPNKYQKIVDSMSQSNDATVATAVIIAALHSTYPCTK